MLLKLQKWIIVKVLYCVYLHFLQMAATVKGEPTKQMNGAMAGNGAVDPKVTTRYRGVGPDGLPRLPPIQRPQTREDPYANSKLLTFRMAKHKQDLLKKIM